MREMKDSGIDWVGNMPFNWTKARLKTMFKIEKRIARKEGLRVLSITQRGIKEKDINSNEGQHAESYANYQIVNIGDYAMNHMDLLTGWIDISQLEGVTSPDYRVFIMSNREYCPEYYLLVFQSCYMNRVFYGLGQGVSSFGRWRLPASMFLNLELPIPDADEQKMIADYLSTLSVASDDLTADIQAQIDILEQYKRTAITEAVTKGINPNTEMKDSGVGWIGQMPSHWNIIRGKYVLRYMQKPIREDDGVVTCFRDGEVTLRSNRREDGFTISEKEIGYQGIDAGDLIVHGMDGFAGSIGISDSRGKASPVLNVLDTDQNKRYIMYYLRSMAYCDVFLALATGIRVRSCDLRWNKLAELVYPVPPIDEQNAIVQHIDETLATSDAIIADRKAQLEVIEQYKKSLIYKYVTGKREVM